MIEQTTEPTRRLHELTDGGARARRRLEGLEVRRPTLEDVYLELTAMRLVVLHELRTEQLLFWRNREAAIFTFFLPVVFFLIFGVVYGDSAIKSEDIRGAAFLEAGMIGYGVAATCFAGLGDHPGRATRVGHPQARPGDAAPGRELPRSGCSVRRSSYS